MTKAPDLLAPNRQFTNVELLAWLEELIALEAGSDACFPNQKWPEHTIAKQIKQIVTDHYIEEKLQHRVTELEATLRAAINEIEALTSYNDGPDWPGEKRTTKYQLVLDKCQTK